MDINAVLIDYLGEFHCHVLILNKNYFPQYNGGMQYDILIY